LVFVVCILSGIALNALVPLFYEMGVELTFPVAGGMRYRITTTKSNLYAHYILGIRFFTQIKLFSLFSCLGTSGGIITLMV
jgi:hypothetical protein